MKGLVLEMVKLRSFISCFSISVSSGCNSAFIALESFVRCSSLPMACSLSPGKSIVPPFGILICWEPRRILLICTPNRFRSFRLYNVLPAHRESSGSSRLAIWISRSIRQSAKRGFFFPCICASMSRLRRFWINRRSNVILLFLSQRESSININIPIAMAIISAFLKRVR